jgi:hypothetical protein
MAVKKVEDLITDSRPPVSPLERFFLFLAILIIAGATACFLFRLMS